MVKNKNMWGRFTMTLNEEEIRIKDEVERLAKKDPSIDKEKLKFKGKVLSHATKELWKWYIKTQGGSYEKNSN